MSFKHVLVVLPKHITPAILKHRDNLDISKAQHELEQAEEEWDCLEETQPTKRTKPYQPKCVSYNEVWNYFQEEDMTDYMKNIRIFHNRKGFYQFLRYLCGPPKLHYELNAERKLVFAIAQCPLDCSVPLHANALQTLYKELMGHHSYCPRYGKHWEEIGFQGDNPSTDTRGVGFLAILQLLYLILNSQTSQIAKDIHKLSQDEMQNFPFCVMSINMTRIALEALREEILNKVCNKREEIMPVVNEFYAGTFIHLYNIWKKEHKTIMDSAFVVKDVTAYVKRNCNAVLQSIQNLPPRRTLYTADTIFSDINGVS